MHSPLESEAAVRSQPEGSRMAVIYKLERPDGTPANPPTIRSVASVTWKAGDTIPLGGRALRMVAVRDDDADQPPRLVVEDLTREVGNATTP